MAYSNVTPPVLPELGCGKVAYNGVQLPDINTVWTGEVKKTHPYAELTDSRKLGGYYILSVHNETYFRATDVYFDLPIGSAYQCYALLDGAWTMYQQGTTTVESEIGFNTNIGSLLWTNNDLLNKDGTVYLAASDPVPIQSYPNYVLVYDYSEGTEDWYQAHLFASATAFVWDGGKIVNPGGETLRQVYDEETGWLDLGTAEPEITPGKSGNVYQRVYTNHDILDAAGNVWLAAGAVTPVEEAQKFPLKSWLMGLALGLAGKPLPLMRQPVAWLYNGVRFPKLPTVEGHQFMIIQRFRSITTYRVYLYCLSSLEHYTNTAGDIPTEGFWLNPGDLRYFVEYPLDATPDSWGDPDAITERGAVTYPDTLWTNVDLYCQGDLYKPAGSLYLAASEPIPVYE